MNTTKSTILALLITFMTTVAFGQAMEQDSALLRTKKVESIQLKSWMAAYGERADTCIEGTVTYNKYGLIEHEVTDYSCSGWDALIETQYEYNEKNQLIRLVTLNNDQIVMETLYEYNDHGEVVRNVNRGFDPPSEVIVYNEQFYGKDGVLDSTYQYSIAGDTTRFKIVFTYTKSGLISKENVYDESGKMVREDHYVYNPNDQLTEVNLELHGQEYQYTKTLIEYNEEGQVRTTLDTETGASVERWYNRQGLVIMTNHFNRFGSLDKQTHYIYTFRD